jgi:hypothetical protein
MNTPLIKLEIEGMRHAIVHAFTQHNIEIEAAVNEEFRRQIEAFDFRDAVAREFAAAMNGAIRSAVERFFYQGSGRDIVEHAVESALRSVRSESSNREKP